MTNLATELARLAEAATRYYIDCEFDGHNGELLSIALVKDDGDGIHIKTTAPVADDWVFANVLPLMDSHNAPKSASVNLHDVGKTIRAFIGDCKRPVIIADSPVDIGRFCRAISTDSGGGWASADYPAMQFEVHNVDCYPTDLPGAVQHNAWWDAMALRHKLAALKAAETPLADDADRKYLIRKNGYWYRPNCSGYTDSAISAGRYSLEDAERYSHPNGKDGPRDGMTVVHEDELTCPDWLAFKQQRDLITAQARQIANLTASINTLNEQSEQLAAELSEARRQIAGLKAELTGHDLIPEGNHAKLLAKLAERDTEIARLREAVSAAIPTVEALADNDLDEPIADNGMTVGAGLQMKAPSLIFKLRAALENAHG